MFVSVIIPTHNRAAQVATAAASVLAQTYREFELIVVDDGSTDDSGRRLLEQFGTQLRMVTHSSNRGVAAARNTGVAASRGDLISFLDSDDHWLPEKLAAQIKFFSSHPAAEICQTEEIWIRDGRRVILGAHQRVPNGQIFSACLRLCLVSPSAVMLRRSLFERLAGFDESLEACEDYDLWLRIACTTEIWRIDQPLVVRHGGHADQLSRRFWGMDRFRIAALIKLLADAPLSAQQRQEVRTVLEAKCRILAQGAAKRGRDDEADRYRLLAKAWLNDVDQPCVQAEVA